MGICRVERDGADGTEGKPIPGQVYIFRGRRGDLIKVLWFDGDGLGRFFEKTRERKIYLAANHERDRVLNARTTVDVTRRDRLAPTGAHADPTASRVHRDCFTLRNFLY